MEEVEVIFSLLDVSPSVIKTLSLLWAVCFFGRAVICNIIVISKTCTVGVNSSSRVQGV